MLPSVKNKATMSILSRLKDKGMPSPAGDFDDEEQDQDIDDGRTIQSMPNLASLAQKGEAETSGGADEEEGQDNEDEDQDQSAPPAAKKKLKRGDYGSAY